MISKFGISMKNKRGRRKGNEKKDLEKATTHPFRFCKDFLLKMSLVDCDKALSKDKTSHNIACY